MDDWVVFSLWLLRIRLNFVTHVSWCTCVGASFRQMFNIIPPSRGAGESWSVRFFFVHVRVVISETDPLNKSLSAQDSAVNCRHNVVQQISRTYSPCINETLYPLKRIFSFPLPTPSHWQPPFYSPFLRVGLLCNMVYNGRDMGNNLNVYGWMNG